MRLHRIPFRSLKVIIIMLGCALHIGCAGVVSKSAPSEEESRFIQQSMELKSGMEREQVHSMVGIPYVASERLKFEIFQSTGEFTEYVGVPPIPVPWLGYRAQAYIPVLFVTYRDDWTVKAYGWDLYRESETSDRKDVRIELDGYTLIRTEPRFTGMMLFSPVVESEKLYLGVQQGSDCVLYLIAPDTPIEPENKRLNFGMNKVLINSKLLINWGGFPYSTSSLLEHYWKNIISDTVFVGFQLPEGVHDLELKGRNERDKLKGSFTCVSGKTYFASIRAKVIDVWSEEGWKLGYRYQVKGEIVISDNWPEDVQPGRQVLMYRDTGYELNYQK